MMIRTLVACTAGLVMFLAYAQPSEACGIKVTAPTSNTHSPDPRSDNPSEILLVGSHSRRLARTLSNSGHDVQQVDNAGAADGADYPVVLTDEENHEDASQQFRGSEVVASTGSNRDNVERIERSLRRAPTDAAGQRVARRVGGQDERQPVEAGAEQPADDERGPAAAGMGEESDEPDRDPVRAQPEEEAEAGGDEPDRPEPRDTDEGDRDIAQAPEPDEPAGSPAESEEPEPSEPEDEPEQVATADGSEQQQEEEAIERSPTPAPAAEAEFHDELTFSNESDRLGADGRQAMSATAAWLQENQDVSIVIEGHTNTPGPSDYNMELSRQRAERARDFLVQQGVDSSRIEVEWFGEDQPAYGDGSDGRNRRVEISR